MQHTVAQGWWWAANTVRQWRLVRGPHGTRQQRTEREHTRYVTWTVHIHAARSRGSFVDHAHPLSRSDRQSMFAGNVRLQSSERTVSLRGVALTGYFWVEGTLASAKGGGQAFGSATKSPSFTSPERASVGSAEPREVSLSSWT